MEQVIGLLRETIPVAVRAQELLRKDQVEDKEDGTVVSICDFALQAMIFQGLHAAFPEDKILGEENFEKLDDAFMEKVQGILPEGYGIPENPEFVVRDFKERPHRVWCIDPIDGTYGFVANGHYGIAIALLEDMKTVLSAVAWPKHTREYTGLPFDGPAIFAAVKGEGVAVYDAEGNRYELPRQEKPDSAILYSRMTHEPFTRMIMREIGITKEITMPSMVKGFILGAGKAVYYHRDHGDHKEWVWDIAPFELFVREAGGFCSTGRGKPIEYREDATVRASRIGLIFSNGGKELHEKLLELWKRKEQYIAEEENIH